MFLDRQQIVKGTVSPDAWFEILLTCVVISKPKEASRVVLEFGGGSTDLLLNEKYVFR
jgi:hypothetical protein